MSVSTVAHDADNVLNLTTTIGNIQDTSNDNTNGLFGKLMNVSTIAHNAYDDMLDLTGQFSNLSQSYYNTSTISLSLTIHNFSGVLSNISNILSTTITSIYSVNILLSTTNRSLFNVNNLLNTTNT